MDVAFLFQVIVRRIHCGEVLDPSVQFVRSVTDRAVEDDMEQSIGEAAVVRVSSLATAVDSRRATAPDTAVLASQAASTNNAGPWCYSPRRYHRTKEVACRLPYHVFWIDVNLMKGLSCHIVRSCLS